MEKVGHVEKDAGNDTPIPVDILAETFDDGYANMVKYSLERSGAPLYADFNCQMSGRGRPPVLIYLELKMRCITLHDVSLQCHV